MSKKLLPEPGMLYLEEARESTLVAAKGSAQTKTMSELARVVRCGDDEVNDNGVVRPMRFKEGDIVLFRPGRYQVTPRGFLAHQDDVAAKIEEWDGVDEMRSPEILMRAVTEPEAFALAKPGNA